MATTLYERLAGVLNSAFSQSSPWPPLDGVCPVDSRDRGLSLLAIYDLHTAPLERVGERAQWASHPAIADIKMRLERAWIGELDAACAALPTAGEPVRAMRALAAKDRLPAIYRWVGEQASLDEMRRFLAIEGGPDGGFDDLVALCQVGLSGAPKMELARNYWDEMGNGNPAEVHTDLHRDMARAIDLPQIARAELPEPALHRSALGGLLATNRWLQPEMLGALGLTELAGRPALPAGARRARTARSRRARAPLLPGACGRGSASWQGLARASGAAAGEGATGMGPAHGARRGLALAGQRGAVRHVGPRPAVPGSRLSRPA